MKHYELSDAEYKWKTKLKVALFMAINSFASKNFASDISENMKCNITIAAIAEIFEAMINEASKDGTPKIELLTAYVNHWMSEDE